MKLLYTDQSLESLEELTRFLLEVQTLSLEKVTEIRTQLLDTVDSLVKHPQMGQKEEYLEHLGKEHRRLIQGHIKVIYRIEGELIYITDFFDTRQYPEKMMG